MEHAWRGRLAAILVLSAEFRAAAAAGTGRTYRPMGRAFRTGFPAGLGVSSTAARAAFPFLEAPLRRLVTAVGGGGGATSAPCVAGFLGRLAAADPAGHTAQVRRLLMGGDVWDNNGYPGEIFTDPS